MNEMLTQGLAVMCIGMGTVLAFLCTVIVSMIIMSKAIRLLNRFCPVAEAGISSSRTTVSGEEETNIAVAIITAMLKK